MQSWAVPRIEWWEGPRLAKMKSSRCSWVCMIAPITYCEFTRFMHLSSFIVRNEGKYVSHTVHQSKSMKHWLQTLYLRSVRLTSPQLLQVFLSYLPTLHRHR